MANLAAKQSLDDFCVDPTISGLDNDEHGGYSPSLISTDKLNSFTRNLQPEPTIQHFDDPIFLRSYTSEEELGSPVGDDDFSFGSASSDSDNASLSGVSEFHVQTNAQQLCNRAQAVQLVSAGKPKVISTPKSVDVSVGPTTPKTARSPAYRSHRMGFIGIDESKTEITSFPSAIEQPPALQSPATPRIRRRPNMTPLKTTPRSESPPGAFWTPRMHVAAQRADFLNHDPFPSSGSPRASMLSPASRRRMQNLSTSLSLRNLGRSLRRSSSSLLDDDSNERRTGKATKGILASSQRISDIHVPFWTSSKPESAVSSPEMSDMHVPTRTSSKPIPKMIARGGNERAPIIELPPCPDGYEGDQDITRTQWPPMRSGLSANDAGRGEGQRRARRSSLSTAALVTAQA